MTAVSEWRSDRVTEILAITTHSLTYSFVCMCVCVYEGNGRNFDCGESSGQHYAGNTITTSLHHYHTMPLPHSSSSSSSSTLQISYNVTLSGGASECVSGFGAGDYQYMDATTAFQR